jgi:hypothetical protein
MEINAAAEDLEAKSKAMTRSAALNLAFTMAQSQALMRGRNRTRSRWLFVRGTQRYARHNPTLQQSNAASSRYKHSAGPL